MLYKLVLLLAAGVVALASAGAHAASITVNIANLPPAGTVVIQVYDSANSFGDFRDPYREEVVRAENGSQFGIDDLPPGRIAVLVYLDQNDNGLIDKNFIGIPREPLGISNNYRPKGPPSFERAAFTLEESSPAEVEIEIFKVLGERGRLGVGAGVVWQSSPYVGSNELVTQPIPAITYNGERLQWLGPTLQYGIVGSGAARLALSASYRIGAYEESDSPALEGLGDRNSTLMAGAGLRFEIPGGLRLGVRYEHDVLNRIGGGQASLRLTKGFQAGIFRFNPHLGANWLSSELANHDFGVPEEGATAERPAYLPGSTYSLEAGLGSFIEITEDWRILFNISLQQFGSNVSDSPIVDTDQVLSGFAAITYVF